MVSCDTEWPLCVIVTRSVVAFDKCLFNYVLQKSTIRAFFSKHTHRGLIEYGPFVHMSMVVMACGIRDLFKDFPLVFSAIQLENNYKILKL